MRKITALKIQSNDKERVNVYLDDEFAFGVSVLSVYKRGLKVGQELSNEEITTLKEEDEVSIALKKALDYSTRALKTRHQLKTYLNKKSYSQKTINIVIDKLVSNGIVDDVEYAKRYIESTKNTQGKRMICYKLIQKGVRKADIEYAFTLTEVNGEDDAFNLLQKRLKNKPIDKEVLTKAYRYLVGKGFSYDEVSYAMDKFKNQIDFNGEDY